MSEDDIKQIIKLEKKLREYSSTRHNTSQTVTDKVLKIFNHLSTVQMTLEILKTTQIGKTVNTFRKHKGEIGDKCKELIKRWKQLLKTDVPCPIANETHSDKSLLHGNDSIASNSLHISHDNHVTVGNNSPSSVSPKKRRGGVKIEDSESMGIGLSKRSRTQVYSGKSIGLKYVPSLFDMCMNILISNIDAIYEVGGIPFFILEPVLMKCTPTQLMRLEELNEHFLEDSDGLWQKHVQKEFRDAVPRDGQTWRDLYIEKLASREERMKTITSKIKANQAKEEPVRKTAVLQTPLPQRSRGGGWGGGNSYFSSQRSLAAGPSGSNLMKQTMKMARERYSMLSSKRGRK